MGALKEAPVIRKPEHHRQVEKLLSEYRLIKNAIEDGTLQESLLYSFPSCTPAYEEKTSPGYSEWQSTTEKYGINRAKHYIKVKRIEKALDCLNEEELELVEKRYFTYTTKNNVAIFEELGWSAATGYRKRKEMLDKLARALNLI